MTPTQGTQRPAPPDLKRLLEIVRDPEVLLELPDPIRLASGGTSRYFIDGKHAVADPENLEFVGSIMVAVSRDAGVEIDTAGGLVLGAVPFVFAVAQAARCRWFLIRKEPKGRGTNLWVEGTRLSPGSRVILVDDVVTTGQSIRQAYDRVQAEGAKVVFATALVDRGEDASRFFQEVNIPYCPLVTYKDLELEPIEHGSDTTGKTG